MTKIQTLEFSGTFCNHKTLISKVINGLVLCIFANEFISILTLSTEQKNTEQELSTADSVVLKTNI